MVIHQSQTVNAYRGPNRRPCLAQPRDGGVVYPLQEWTKCRRNWNFFMRAADLQGVNDVVPNVRNPHAKKYV
jgi:hypothetical protein